MSNREAISRVEAAEKELALAKRALKKDAATYSIGDRFLHNSTEKYILIAVTGGGVSNVMLSSLRNGHGCGYSVEDWNKITIKEIPALNIPFARYWDSQKKEYTDGR